MVPLVGYHRLSNRCYYYSESFPEVCGQMDRSAVNVFMLHLTGLFHTSKAHPSKLERRFPMLRTNWCPSHAKLTLTSSSSRLVVRKQTSSKVASEPLLSDSNTHSMAVLLVAPQIGWAKRTIFVDQSEQKEFRINPTSCSTHIANVSPNLLI